jgi:hypothetical protein
MEADFKELGGITFSSKPVGNSRALLHESITGRLFDHLTDQDFYFLPSDSWAFCIARMAKPANHIEGNRLANSWTRSFQNVRHGPNSCG